MGWLGWSAEQALHTPVAQILLALDGKIEFLKLTTPGMKKPEADKPKMLPADKGWDALFQRIGTRKVVRKKVE